MAQVIGITEKVSVSTRQYLAVVFRLLVPYRVRLAAIAVTVGALMALMRWDSRYALALALLLIVFAPLVMMLVYYYYALSPESRLSILEKTVTLDDDGITLTFSHENMEVHRFAWGEFDAIGLGVNVVVLRFKGKDKARFIALPQEMLRFTDDLEARKRFNQATKHLKRFVL